MITTLRSFTITNPIDAHMHWRLEETLMPVVAPYSIRHFVAGILMPNTEPRKIMKANDLQWYTESVNRVLKNNNSNFLPMFTYFLSEELSITDLTLSWNMGLVHAVKYYPKGGTTDSAQGLVGFKKVWPIIEQMQKLGIPLLIYGETPEYNGEVVGDFKREKLFMETELVALVESFPKLRIVLEHISTKAAVDFVLAHDNVWATITPQHCLFDDRALFNGMTFDERVLRYSTAQNGMNPSLMCRPILKDIEDVLAIQAALIKQAREGLRKFFLGTDTAPHISENKYKEACACGMFTSPIALQMYAIAFEQMGILHHLQAFASDIAAEFYNIKNQLSGKTIILSPDEQFVEKSYSGIVTPYAGLIIPWTATVGDC